MESVSASQPTQSPGVLSRRDPRWKGIRLSLDQASTAPLSPPRLAAAGGDGAKTPRRLHKFLGTWPRRAATFVIVTVVGAVIAQFVPDVRNSVFPPDRGFHATILRPPDGPPDVRIRERPTNSSLNVGTLAPGTGVVILCTAHGNSVTGPGHGGGTVTSRLWDKVQIDASNDLLGFVPDALVNTGTTKPEAPAC